MHQARELAICLAVAGLSVAAYADRNEPSPFSHLEPHISAEQLSHLNAHRDGLPPPALLLMLGNGVDGVLKGVRLADEARLIDALIRENLSEQILRVGVAQVSGQRMAVIKLQAGDKRTGAFSLSALQEDAVRCLKAAFGRSLRLDHLDLWAVVPGGEVVEEQWENLPIFSASVSRARYELAAGLSEGGLDVLARLDAVRYSPLFLRYAGSEGGPAPDTLPRSAYTDPDLAEQWDALLAEARSPTVATMMALQTDVRALFHGERQVKQVALTIDDGPHPLVTPLMLGILKDLGVKATFFVVGRKCEQYPALLRMILREGHEVANHAYSNQRLRELSADEAWAQVRGCHKIVARLTGESMRYFRPPGGGCSSDGLRAVGALRYTTAFWTRNTGDWRKPPPAEIVRNALTGLEAGDIILMHQGDMCSVHALPAIIEGVRRAGLEPTALGQIDLNGGAVLDTPEALTRLVNSRLGGERID